MFKPNRVALVILALVVVAGFSIPWIAAWVGAGRIRAAAEARGFTANWTSLNVDLLGRCRIRDLSLTATPADTALRAGYVEVGVSPWSMLILQPRLSRVVVRDARARAGVARTVDPDTLAPEPAGSSGNARADRLQRMVESAAGLLLAPARTLPPVSLERVLIETGGSDETIVRGVAFDRLELRHSRGRTSLALAGTVHAESAVGFGGDLSYGQDDRIEGSAALAFPSRGTARPETLSLALAGTVQQDRGSGRLIVAEDTRLTVGRIPIRLSGSILRAGPRVSIEVAADSLTQDLITASLPSVTLGRLREVAVRGAFHYRLSLDLDFDRPEDMNLSADVQPLGLRLDPARTRLRLLGLDSAFVASIHLPRAQVVQRELSAANPHFLTLGAMDSVLAWSVVTNEDGGFFRHRGFNLDAVKSSVAENIRAGAYRRGAGTITMQLARNLYLGHDRTLSRKFQEVVLAWILEHLTGVSKRRLLEIYLNIIEWGPGIHGADEATHFYFAHDADRVTTAEALFLATVIPAPRKWSWRFDDDGALKPWARDQMHFIGRAMIAKSVLAPEALPTKDSLYVQLKAPLRITPIGPPPDSTSNVPAPVDSSSPRTVPTQVDSSSTMGRLE